MLMVAFDLMILQISAMIIESTIDRQLLIPQGITNLILYSDLYLFQHSIIIISACVLKSW